MGVAYNGVSIGTTPPGSTLVGNPLPTAGVDGTGKVRALLTDADGTLHVTSSGGGGGVVSQPDHTLLNDTSYQGGVWNVGLSAGANAIGSVTVSSSALPTGAATSAKQPALGTAGTASTDVLTVQGIASMTALKVDGSATTQPVSGTVTANLGTIGSAATAASQTNVQSAPGTPQTVAVTVQGNASGVAIPVSLSGTVTVSGTVAATQSGPWTNTVTQATGSNLHTVVDSGTIALSAGSAVIGHVLTDTGSTTAVTGNVTVVQGTGSNLHVAVDSGTVTANAGSGTFAVSAASLPLPTGASTSAKQPALGTAGTASADVLTVQGIASMTALKVDPSGVTSPVSLATLPALTAGSAVIGHVINDASSAVIGHVIADSGSTTAVTGNVTVVQPTGTNLHVVVDSGTVTAANASVSATGSAVPASATMTGGTDGTNLRAILTDTSGRQIVNVNGNVAITAASLPLPTGAALDASVTGLQVAQASTTSGQVGNLVQGATTTAAPSYTTAKTNPLSLTTTGDLRVALAVLPALATGANTIGAVTLTDGTNVANVVSPVAGQNSLLMAGNALTVAFTTTTVQAVGSTDCLNLRGVCVHIIAQGGSSTVNFQQSSDNSNWIACTLMAINNTGTGAGVNGTGSSGNAYRGNVYLRYFRLNVTGIASGTTSGNIQFYSQPFQDPASAVVATEGGTWSVSQSGIFTVQPGNTANTTPWLTSPAAGATGGYSFNHIATNTTTTVKSGAGYLRSIVINTPGVADTITVYDNTAGSGTVIAIINDASASAVPLVYDAAFATGLTLVTAGTTPPDITVMYK